ITITFKERSTKENLIEKRSILIKGDSVRINDAEWSISQMKERHEIAAKLTNLPPNTTAWDLKNILTQCKGCTCYIPRTATTYYRARRFALISFETQEDLLEAVQDKYILGETELTFTPITTKLC